MMRSKETTREDMWARQQIGPQDVDYALWNARREQIRQMSKFSHSCFFTVDVYKGKYDFASESFSVIFGYEREWINTIQRQGDLLEERIHPDDRDALIAMQVEHSRFIYSLPPENRNDYRNSFQFRMMDAKGKYINIISSQQVLLPDKNGKAWIVMGTMDISPDQSYTGQIKCSSFNLRTCEMVPYPVLPAANHLLTQREIQILELIGSGLLSKEIAHTLNISIHTVNNHRKNIFSKLGAGNAIEAVNLARKAGL